MIGTTFAQPAQKTFTAAVERFAREHERMGPEDIYAEARAAFEPSPDEIIAKINLWLQGLPAHVATPGYTLVKDYSRTSTPAEVDQAIRERPASNRLFMQALQPEDIALLIISQIESMGIIKERQSYQIGRVYVRPKIELISSDKDQVRLAIYDFDNLIEVTAVRATAGVMCPVAFRVFSKSKPTP